MPFANNYNRNIHNKLNQIYKNHIDNEDSINDNTMKDKHVIAGELEHLTSTNKNLQGGNHEEATLRDMGYEKTKDDDIKPIRKKRTMVTETQLINGSGLSAGGMADCGMPIDKVGHGMSAGAMDGCGLSAGAKKPRATRKKKIIDQPVIDKPPETGGDLKDVLDTAAGIAKTVAPFAPLLLGLGKDHVKRVDIVKKSKKGGTLLTLKDADFSGDVMGAQPIESGGVKPLKGHMKVVDMGKDHVKRSDIVKKVMQEKGLKLIEASKFVKEHNLYTPKEKKVKEKKVKMAKIKLEKSESIKKRFKKHFG